MSSITYSPVRIQTSSQSVPALPSWFGEVTIIAHYLTHLGMLEALCGQVRFARRRFGHYEVIDFFAVLVGYARSFEPTLERFYQCVLPIATPFMALFGREQLPHRSTLSRFLAAIDQVSVDALRARFQKDLQARPLTRGAERVEEVCGIDREYSGWFSTSMGRGPPARQRAVHCGGSGRARTELCDARQRL